ncbi:MAG: dTMP kinase [Candidatus Marsarchaeota archaeon]|nr:dTMP kinase [Candidatus Marsarchaeota archaeon]
MLIVFEGIDGSGKSTQAELLTRRLVASGVNASWSKEPTHGLVGRLIREHVLSKPDLTDPVTIALLYAADRAGHLSDVRKEGRDVLIFDRYYYSSIAYQGALGASRSFIESVNSFAPVPDMVFLLDLPVEVSLGRKGSTDEFEKLGFLEKVRKIYLELAEARGI